MFPPDPIPITDFSDRAACNACPTQSLAPRYSQLPTGARGMDAALSGTGRHTRSDINERIFDTVSRQWGPLDQVCVVISFRGEPHRWPRAARRRRKKDHVIEQPGRRTRATGKRVASRTAIRTTARPGSRVTGTPERSGQPGWQSRPERQPGRSGWSGRSRRPRKPWGPVGWPAKQPGHRKPTTNDDDGGSGGSGSNTAATTTTRTTGKDSIKGKSGNEGSRKSRARSTLDANKHPSRCSRPGRVRCRSGCVIVSTLQFERITRIWKWQLPGKLQRQRNHREARGHRTRRRVRTHWRS